MSISNNKNVSQKATGIDFEIFKANKQKCTGFSDCSHLLRIINSLKYYETLLSSNVNAKRIFIQFCVDRYVMFLDDYIHFVCVHSHHLKEITDHLETNGNLLKCNNINQCKSTQRHYRNRIDDTQNENNTDNDEQEDKYNFYVEMFDTIHFYLFHLEHLGLRVLNKKTMNVDNNNDPKKDDMDYLNCIDEEIVFISKQIEAKRQKYNLHFHRLETVNNSKFLIQQTGHDIVAGNQNGNAVNQQIKQGIK